MKKILLAFQFLTIIPLGNTEDISEKEIGGTTAFFPLVGFVQGLLLTVSADLFLRVFPPEAVNGLIVLVIVLTNGGFHIEGLSDTFDAIASKGDKEKKLMIMKDSTVGVIGVVSVVLAILLKFLFLNALFLKVPPVTYYASLFLMPVFSRWAMVPAIFHAKPARQDGLGKIFIENTGLKELLGSTSLTLFLVFLVLFAFGSRGIAPGSVFFFILPLLYVFAIIAVWFSNRRFGGMTGDTFGAVSEISEILFLMVIVCLQNFI